MIQYVADAFTGRVFAGNPAAVCVRETPLDEALMQKIARENNLSETAFAVGGKGKYHLRWFTPTTEIDLCGHATLATAFVILTQVEPGLSRVEFETMSGRLTVAREGELFSMDFPAYGLTPVPVTEKMAAAVGVRPVEAWMGRDLLLVLESEEQVRACAPDMEKVAALDGLLLHITAEGEKYDCVSRSFAPKTGVAEDPVCGSGHCHIVPYWARRKEKDGILAFQASARTGVLHCRMAGERVTLSGEAVLYSRAELFIEE